MLMQKFMVSKIVMITLTRGIGKIIASGIEYGDDYKSLYIEGTRCLFNVSGAAGIHIAVSDYRAP